MHQKKRSHLDEPVGIHGPSNQQLPTAMGERPARLFINMAMNPVNPQLFLFTNPHVCWFYCKSFQLSQFFGWVKQYVRIIDVISQ